MPHTSFDQLLDAIEELSVEEQADLLDVVRRRLVERGRSRILEDVREAESQFANGQASATSVGDLMKKIQS